jgi:polyhydroxyalkanoate synthase
MNFGSVSASRLSPKDMALIPPDKLTEIEKEYQRMFFNFCAKFERPWKILDFEKEAWHEGWSSFIYQSYLINSQHLMSLAQAVRAKTKGKAEIIFATEQIVSTLAPTNF